MPDSELHTKATEEGWLFTESVTEEDASVALDLTIPEAYDYFKERMSFFTDLGVKGYKNDRGDEDEMPTWEQNVQTYLYQKLLYENQAEKWGADKGKATGFYNFARSVIDRARKYTGVWAADPRSTFEGLEYSLKAGIRSGLLGFPMWGSDCGGYTREPDDGLPEEDVWQRWMWFSAFSPVYELMLNENSIPWYDYSEDVVSTLARTAELHHHLLPYIQTYLYKATKDGLPLIRAAFLESPDDEKSWDVEDAYFFGSEFYIAPIISENNKRQVYFPQGGKYLNYINKEDVYSGGEEVEVTSDFDSMPAFVREGAIIPTGDLYQFNALWLEGWKPWLNIEAYPSFAVGNSAFQYYEESTAQEVEITMETARSNKSICVSYGSLATSGKLRIYLKSSVEEFELRQQGGRECVDSVTTLFD